MDRYSTALCVLALMPLAVFGPRAANGSGEDWYVYRGPHMNDTASGTNLLTAGTDVRLEVVWKRKLGSGYSGVSVQGRTAVTLFADSGFDYAAAFDVEDGKELWRFQLDTTYPGHYGSQSGPISTPLIANGTVLALAPRGRLVALSLDSGELIWEADLVQELGSEEPYYGFATSPIPFGGYVLLETGGPKDAAVTAFDLKTGTIAWRSGEGTVKYQSPVLMDVDGAPQLLYVVNKQLAGLDPSTGRLLWKKDFEGSGGPIGSQSSNIIVAGRNRVLIKDSLKSSRLVGLGGADTSWTAEDIWTTPHLKNSYVVPVYHDGFFYGYNTRILTCVNAQTGELAWRSREPGDGFPILVDGHLVIVTKGGALSVAKASPEGYREMARLELFDDLVWTPASFGAESLFLRSFGEMARVAIVPSERRETTSSVRSASIDDSSFGRFVRDLKAATAKAQLLNEYLSSQEHFPIVENEDTVHFVYRGPEEDVGLVSELFGGRTDQPMIRVEGTDLFYYSARVEPDALITYQFLKDFEETTNDLLNPSTVSVWGYEVSVVAMPEWEPPAHLREPSGLRGRIETLELPASGDEPGKPIQVYLPAGYGDSDRRYPVAYVHGGEDALEEGLMDHTLDNLIGSTVSPIVVVFLPTFGHFHYGELVGKGKAKYAHRVVNEIVPLIDKTYATIPRPEARASIGQGFCAYASFYTTVSHPGVFQKLGLQTMMWEPGFAAENGSLIRGPEEQPLTIYLDWGKYDGRNPFEGWDNPGWSRAFAKALKDKGYSFTGREWNEGGGYFVSWRNRTDKLLETLFPLSPVTGG